MFAGYFKNNKLFAHNEKKKIMGSCAFIQIQAFENCIWWFQLLKPLKKEFIINCKKSFEGMMNENIKRNFGVSGQKILMLYEG